MKWHNGLLTFVFTIAASNLPAQRPVSIDSRVISATVFLNRAMVTRQADVQVDAGPVRLVMDRLTPGLQDESVRLSGEGTAEVTILDVKVETEFTAEIHEKEIRELQSRLDSLLFEIKAVNDGKAVLETQRAFIESIRMEYPKEINQQLPFGRASVQEWRNTLSFFDIQLTSIYSRLRNAQMKLNDLAKKQAAMEKEIQNRRSRQGDALRYKRIVATAAVRKAGSLSMVASYIVPDASWYPVYDARVSSSEANMVWTCYGMVRQNTGEDWKDVRLSLSTAQPMRYQTVPELSPWYLDVSRPKKERIYKIGETAAAPMGDQDLGVQAAVSQHEESETKRSVEYSFADVNTNLLSTVFTVPTKSNIPSGNEPHKITVSMQSLAAAFEYVALPKLAVGVFLRSRSVNKTDAPFLRGEVNVFLDGDFINKTAIESVVPSDTLKLALGTDDAVQVERKFINRFTEGKGVLGGKKRVTDEYEITVTNNRRNEIMVSVTDQLPISQNEKISVRLLQPDEREADMDRAKQIQWRLRLKPGEKRILPFKYQVEFPGDVYVQGL
ncbi:MAG TPA: mucoidy inhibitor MuiA family protein [bacterium]